jgi:hypothetical protein
MALYHRRPKDDGERATPGGRVEPRLGPEPRRAPSEVFDTGRKTIIDCAHVRVERLDTHPVLFSKVFKEFEDGRGRRYDYRYWAERENFFLREFLKKQKTFTHVVQARHLISENEAAKQVLTCDAGITIADWLRVKSRYADTATLSHPFQRPDMFLRLIRACLVALKEIHEHRIVHCDFKEDNICIPYAPDPAAGGERRIRLEFERLKLIDFAFSIAHAIPLTQILVIDPAERLPYQSELLISALRADRRSGSPNAVQQLDYRVDLFSLGYLAEKISAAGLDSSRASRDSRVPEGVSALVRKLKSFDSLPSGAVFPHDALIAEVDRLLAATGGVSQPQEFVVDGEWTVEEMAQGRGAGRRTPMTPVALPLQTPVSVPPEHIPRRSGALSRIGVTLLYALAPFAAAVGVFLYLGGSDHVPQWLFRVLERTETALMQPPRPSGTAPVTAAPPEQVRPKAGAEAADRIALLLRSDDDAVFQAAAEDLTRLMTSDRPAALAIAGSIATAYGGALAGSGSRATRSRALARLMWMANAGNTFAAARVAAFEKDYDEAKQTVARSAWWMRGEDPQPEGAARWIENGAVLAENGDRPAMLDRAFAMGYGRALQPDRATAVETYLTVMARADGSDQTATKLRQSAGRGLLALLNTIVEQKDQDAVRRVLPALESKSGAAGVQYYLGLMNECVAQPANLEAARQWYRKAAADPAWKRTADDKLQVIGTWCPATT